MNKVCKDCGKKKDLGEFVTDKNMRDGKLNTCKTCMYERKRSHDSFSKRNGYTRKWRKKIRTSPLHRAKELFDAAKKRAARSNVKFDLGVEWVLEQLDKQCPITGISFVITKEKRHPYSPSIDRIQPELGYTKENCRLVIYQYNVAKNIWDDNQVLEFARKLLERR